jgi:hypothetical protein
MCTQLTYEGFLDEIFGLQAGTLVARPPGGVLCPMIAKHSHLPVHPREA